MSTISKATRVNKADLICQGDIFQNVKYSYVNNEDDNNVEIVEMVFPYAIIVSQACDVIAMDKMIKDAEGKPTKFMPSILLCPIYDLNSAKVGTHISDAFSEFGIKLLEENVFQSDDRKVASRDWHYRFHPFSMQVDRDMFFENTIIDFKHYFTVPMSYLVNNKDNRLFHLEDLFAEQITLKFATYLSRVAIP